MASTESSPISVSATSIRSAIRSSAAPQKNPATPKTIALSPTSTAQEKLPGIAGPSDAQKPNTEVAIPLHISYPTIGMDQSVLALYPTDAETLSGSIVPPPTLEAYWLTNYGSPGPVSTNTTYIVGHSWEGRGSPFNNISSQAKLGDRFIVTTTAGNLTFVVEKITTETKDTLRQSYIWDIVPGRLIIITCFTEDLWGKNIVLQASTIG
ncbi:class F sortase (plasmid) [Arthrobacter sp. TMP15]|uniref:class F sortase n=1 Tax=Arthrobacter sp. TMP15 TaxID=3140789 RepID=UPI0031B9DEB6